MRRPLPATVFALVNDFRGAGFTMRYIHHYILKTQQHGRGDSLELGPLVSDFFRAKPNVVKRHCSLGEKIINQQKGDFSSLKNVGSVVAFLKLNGIRVVVGCSSEHYAVDLHRPD
jgi:hypothetical protein